MKPFTTTIEVKFHRIYFQYKGQTNMEILQIHGIWVDTNL